MHQLVARVVQFCRFLFWLPLGLVVTPDGVEAERGVVPGAAVAVTGSLLLGSDVVAGVLGEPWAGVVGAMAALEGRSSSLDTEDGFSGLKNHIKLSLC